MPRQNKPETSEQKTTSVKAPSKNFTKLQGREKSANKNIKEEAANVQRPNGNEEPPQPGSSRKRPSVSAPSDSPSKFPKFEDNAWSHTDELALLLKEALDNIKPDLRGQATDEVFAVLEHYSKDSEQAEADEKGQNSYLELLAMTEAPYVANSLPFDCAICLSEQQPGEGVTLKNCLHTFCKLCLVRLIETSQESEIKCPYVADEQACYYFLTQSEIKAVVSEDAFNKFLERSLRIAESQNPDSFHCKTADCPGWCVKDTVNEVAEFLCPVCEQSNCLSCNAIHKDMTCEMFAGQSTVDGLETLTAISQMVKKKKAMPCPLCRVLVAKDKGCDNVLCTICKTEICWATRGPRWGPAGQGDTSGGCRCGVGGKKCHRSCRNCH